MQPEDMKKKPDAYWREKLSVEQYEVLRQKGTEQPYTGELLHNNERGMYECVACGNPLFSSDTKFDSHCGWPSFDREIKGNIELHEDNSFGMHRIEVTCNRCGGHLGHVFDDGPTETGKRFCINSLALAFQAESNKKTDA